MEKMLVDVDAVDAAVDAIDAAVDTVRHYFSTSALSIVFSRGSFWATRANFRKSACGTEVPLTILKKMSRAKKPVLQAILTLE